MDKKDKKVKKVIKKPKESEKVKISLKKRIKKILQME